MYTALLVLLLESFIASNTFDFNEFLPVLTNLPEDTCSPVEKQKWFRDVLQKIEENDLWNVFHNWCIESSKKNPVFRLWTFILFSLFEPLIEFYMAIRTCNFEARNAAFARIAPLFFGTNHRNYARLSAQHLVDLDRSSDYLMQRLSSAFAVNRTNRAFSSNFLRK